MKNLNAEQIKKCIVKPTSELIFDLEVATGKTFFHEVEDGIITLKDENNAISSIYWHHNTLSEYYGVKVIAVYTQDYNSCIIFEN